MWALDASWLFFTPNDYFQRAKWVSRAIHGFLLFMVINSAIVFVPPHRTLAKRSGPSSSGLGVVYQPNT